jgi:predicted ATP-grasp superfamily ATP-dependent carboligase
MNTNTPIVAFGLSAGLFHHGVLGIARSAGRLGVPIYRVGLERRAPAALSRYLRGWRAVSSSAPAAPILETLDELSREIGRAILIPVDDAASVFTEEHAEVLASDFLFPQQPPGLARALSSKREMNGLCQQHGIPTPLSVFPQSALEVIEHSDGATFPIVVKCINAGGAGASAPRVTIAQNRDEVLEAYRLIASPDGSNVMLQEYIPGTPEAVWMFNGYFDEQSECKIGFTGRKIRQAPPYTGASTLGVCLPNPIVHEMTVRLMKAVGYRGILDIGYRFDRRDNEYKLLDVNPRIGGTFRLFVGKDGMDVLRALYLDLTAQEVPVTTAREGRRWIVEPLDLRSSGTYARRGELSLGGWVRSLRGVQEAAWYATDDPLPFLVAWIWLVLDRLPRLRSAIGRLRLGRRMRMVFAAKPLRRR